MVDQADEITLWKAPQSGRLGSKEITFGYDPAEYPGDGPYFTTDPDIADVFQAGYKNGIEVIHIPNKVFHDLVDLGVIVPDAFYPLGKSYHVPVQGLPAFNQAIKLGSPNEYHPQD